MGPFKKIRYYFFFFIFLSLLNINPSEGATAWVKATVFSQRKVPLYKDPDLNSQILGRYASGTVIQVYGVPRNDFYAIYFAQPFQGSHFVWIPKSEVRVQGQGGSLGPKDTIRLGGIFYNFGPSDIQTALGDPASSFISIGFSAEYEKFFSPEWSAVAQISRSSFSQPVKTANDPLVVYSATSYTLLVGPVYHFYNKDKILLSASAGLGIAISDAGNTGNGPLSGTVNVVTNFILNYPLYVNLTGAYSLSTDWGIFARLGYIHQSLSNIPIVNLPDALTFSSSNFNLSAFFGSIGVQIKY